MKSIRYTLFILLACLAWNGCQDVEEPADTVPEVVTDAVVKFSDKSAYLSGTVSSKAQCYFLIATSEDMSDAQKIEKVYFYKNEESTTWRCNTETGNLTPGTTYYVMLCATDGHSEVKGDMVSFTTGADLSIESVKEGGKEYVTDALGVYLARADETVLYKYGNLRAVRNDYNRYTLPYSVTLTDPVYKVYAYSPYEEGNSPETLNEIEVKVNGTTNYLYGSCEVSPGSPKANIEMQSALARLYFILSTDSKEAVTINYLHLDNANKQTEKEFISTRGYLDLITGKITPNSMPDHKGIIMNTFDYSIHSGLHSSVEMLVIPTSFDDGEIELIVSADNHPIRIAIPAATWEAGKAYQIVVQVNIEAPKAKVGDYYYSDGTWSTEYNAAKECIGIVFALSKTAYGNIDPSLKESAHGRIVALEDLKDAGNGWNWYGVWGNQPVYSESVCFTGYAGNNTGSGGYLPVDGKNKYIETSGSIPYNYENWLVIPSGANPKQYALCDYNGNEWTHNHGGTAGITDVYNYKVGNKTWFVPSVGEMARLAMAYGYYDRFSDKTGFIGFSDFTYWTSCAKEAGSSAWSYCFYSGYFGIEEITTKHYIRPITAF